MNTFKAAAVRRVGIAVLIVSGWLVAAPAFAAQVCNGNPRARIDPLSQTVAETTAGVPTVVTLNGSGSTPANSVTYAWQYLGSTPTGIPVSLANPTSVTPTFAAPNVGSAGATLHFKLTVCGVASTAATTDINVTDVVMNNPPTAAATVSPSSAHEGDLVTLDGTPSYDLDPGTTLTYHWSQVGGSPTVALTNLDAAGSRVTFVAPNTPVTTGAALTFRLTVSDGSLSASTDKIANIVWTNDPPVASLVCPGGVIDVNEGGAVTLDGSASADSDGSIASYAWDQLAGLPNLGVGALTTPSIGFTAPQLGYNQLGGITLRLTVTDDVGASDSAECAIFIHDVTPPSIVVPGDITAEAQSAAGATQSYVVTAIDAVDDEFAYALPCTPPSGSVFPMGDTTVQCAATDSAGNQASASFKVTVQDTVAPVLQAHADVAVEATSSAGALVEFDAPIASDAVDAAPGVTCTPASGSQFALGASTVQCDAVDGAGNHASPITFQVNVMDTTPPTIDAHSDITGVEATGPGGAVVTFANPATHDVVDGDGTATCTPTSGSTFALGTNTVTCDAHDAANNQAIASTFAVQVVDTTPPVIAAHGDVGPIEATSAAGAIVSYTLPTTSDVVDGAGLASCSPLSGSQFALGDTNVACSAVDHAHNVAVITYFKVTVRDTTAPEIAAHGNVTAEATGPAGAVVAYTAPATSDAVDGSHSATCLPVSGSTFALGSTTVTCSAHDAAGNVSTPTSFTVSVIDTTAPVIAAHADVLANATGNSSVLVSYTLPTASDLVDGLVAVTCLPASGTSFSVGTTTVNCSATDNAGNTGHGSFNVVVSYTFTGFYRPVDNFPTVNVVKAGSAVPVKFSLGGDQGLNIFATGYPASVATSCSAAATDAIEETVTAGGSSLSYDPTSGQYIYVWKTDRSWTGCRQLVVKLRDGSSRSAAFSFTR